MSESFQKKAEQIVVFTLDEMLYALPLSAVEKVIHVVEIRPLPQSPEFIAGIINLQGRVIPVADMRKRFGLPEHEIDLNDLLIVTDIAKMEVAILVDSVIGIRELSQGQSEKAAELLPFAEHIKGVTKVDDELVLIYDFDRFLSLDQEKQLNKALAKNRNDS